MDTNVFREFNPFGLGLHVENRHFSFEIRWLHIDHKAPLEPAAQAIQEAGDIFRRPVRRDDNLLAVLVQLVESMEELFLRPFPVG